MADGSFGNLPSLKGEVSEAEWRIRTDLAALYRLAAREHWDDRIFTHISARIPGPEHHFLLNPVGYLFEEMTASSLVKIDLDGNVLQDTPYFINAAGFTIHSAIHAAREDALFVIHLHTAYGAAVSAQTEGLLPLTQSGLGVLPRLAYHDYEGIALDLDERERIVADLGDKSAMILRNHGTLTVGPSAVVAWNTMVSLERACMHQILALSAGRERVLIAPQPAQETVARQTGGGRNNTAVRELLWAACLRQLDREMPGYDT